MKTIKEPAKTLGAAIAGTGGTVSEQGDLTYRNLIHLRGIDGTGPADLARGKSRVAGRRFTLWKHCDASCRAARMPNCATSV